MTRSHPQPSRRTVLGGAALTALTAVAGGAGTANAAASSASAATWPTEFPLPDGFLPEGITIGRKPYAYMGSRANGAVYRTDLRTGEGGVIHEGVTGTASIGLKADHDGLLYISGGGGGTARVVDSRTGRLVTTYQLTGATGHFINDVILLGDRAWFTDSRDSVLYGVPRGRAGEVRGLPLGGDWVQTPDVNNANGIVSTPDGRGLIVVSSTPGKLYRVDLRTGHATEIALDGADDVAFGDGLLRIGRTLYVVQNRQNLISVFDLDAEVRSATLRRTITDPRFDVPTTVARWGDRLYLVNARFTSPQTPDTTFNGVAVSL
ncbi:SMP-30/gluconolactonase/LRE family protein [Streptomyces sporangiiformans]|uniref:Superoxide dismutase n=1 Tax=Streptomyces sporangiiformans TaxID=2315329 RepID=A0A505DAT6_9ACTN|nr:superoxide dismutase [Streptomyces sporangiiformans]TPQ18835.1 superoxide dismutase [Streptomyces sporangiiformans]